MYALPALLGAADVFSNESVVKFMNLALGIIASNMNTKRNLEALNAEIERFKELGTDPTDEDFQNLLDRSNAAHDTIQNA
jgi:hypothetical protein